MRTDNGASTERLAYPDDDPQTVIAVGGGTLSRGLTLEGLVTSFFLRTSQTYDTLLQMGRWFGFRHGYADLVRVWAGPGLLDDFAFLSDVEDDLRAEIRRLDEEGSTPAVVGIKVLQHPGRLQITAGNKMQAAKLVDAQLGGQRYQVTYLDISERGIERNRRAADALVLAAKAKHAPLGDTDGGYLLRKVSSTDVLDFLTNAWVPHDVYPWLEPKAVRAWLTSNAPDTTWNVVLMSPGGNERARHEFAGGLTVNTAVRNPESTWDERSYRGQRPQGATLINLGALLTEADELADIELLRAHGELDVSESAIAELRRRAGRSSLRELERPNLRGRRRRFRLEHLPGQGLIVLYAIDKDSRTKENSNKKIDSKKSLESFGLIENPIGFGIVFPTVDDPDAEKVRYAVDPLAEMILEPDDEEDDIRDDDEGDHYVREGGR